MEHKKRTKITLRQILTFSLIFVVLIIIAYYFLLYLPKCEQMSCFKNELGKCGKAQYLNAGKSATWLYEIKGFSGDYCEVHVKNIAVNAGVKAESLQGKEMTCLMPKETLGAFLPEEKIEYCHGLLKEEIQNMIIDNMHLYIIQNIGEINQDLSGIK